MNCTHCGKELTNGLDTFGDVGNEICQECWIHLPETYPTHDWYGLAPHIHDLDITGSVIGSTVFVEYRDKPRDETGHYEISPGLWFWPDPETGGAMGVWTQEGVK